MMMGLEATNENNALRDETNDDDVMIEKLIECQYVMCLLARASYVVCDYKLVEM